MVEFYMILVYVLAYIGLFATTFYGLNLFLRSRNPEIKEATDKTVSIVIPAFNEEKSIARTIESALALDYPKEKLEIIVVDDGSRDKTYKIAKKFESKKSPRIRVFTKPNGGKGSALNLGIRNSKSEIIVTMDADSFARPDSLRKMIGHFYNDRVMAVTPSMGVYKPSGFWERVQQIEYYMGVFLRKSFASMNAIHITPGAFSAYRRNFFVKHGGYDEKNITEDLEIALRIQSHGYILENASKAAVYTLVPKNFKPLMVQRRRWYTGLIRNLWAYRRLFGLKKGPLGVVVLPVAISTVVLSCVLFVYAVTRSLMRLSDELSSLKAVNFDFGNSFRLNSYMIERFFYTLFSQPVFLITLMFVSLLAFYLYFSRKNMLYSEGVKVNFFAFLISYSFLFAFWWILSFFYILFNKKVVWRES